MNLFIHTIINLFIVFLCAGGLYLALFYYKRSIKRSGVNLQIIETLQIDSKNILCLVRFRDREVLLALSGGAVQVLCIESKDKEERE